MPDDSQPRTPDRQRDRLTQALREPLLDSCQAAAMLKIHPRTLQRMVHRGKIHAIQVGRLWRFKASALDAWMDR